MNVLGEELKLRIVLKMGNYYLPDKNLLILE